jgi:hypothetical protein
MQYISHHPGRDAQRDAPELSEHDRQQLLVRLSGTVDAVGCTREFSSIQQSLRYRQGDSYDRLLQALAAPKMEGERLRGALMRLSEVDDGRLPTAVELVRLRLPITEETLGFGPDIRAGSAELTRRVFLNLKTIDVLARMNAQRLEPPEAERVDSIRPRLENILMMQTSNRYLNMASAAFREIFDGRDAMRLQPTPVELERYLLDTGFGRDKLAIMPSEQRYAVWGRRVDELRMGFPKPPLDPQPNLPGLL